MHTISEDTCGTKSNGVCNEGPFSPSPPVLSSISTVSDFHSVSWGVGRWYSNHPCRIRDIKDERESEGLFRNANLYRTNFVQNLGYLGGKSKISQNFAFSTEYYTIWHLISTPDAFSYQQTKIEVF